MATDGNMRLRLLRGRVEQARPRLAAEAAERVSRQAEAGISAVADLLRRREQLEVRHRGDELAERVRALGAEGREVVRAQEAAAEDMARAHAEFRAKAPWLVAESYGFRPRPPQRPADEEAAREERRSLLLMTRRDASALLVEQASRYHRDPDAQHLFDAVWHAPVAARVQLLPDRVRADVEAALVEANATKPLLEQDALAVAEAAAVAQQVEAALREADLLPPPERAPVTTATRP